MEGFCRNGHILTIELVYNQFQENGGTDLQTMSVFILLRVIFEIKFGLGHSVPSYLMMLMSILIFNYMVRTNSTVVG